MRALDLIFPKYCLECHKTGQYICSDCLSQVPTAHIISPDSYAIWRYEGVIKRAILALKYKFASDIASELALLASSQIIKSSFPTKGYTLIPIPLHSKRQKWRGFNQAEEIGKRIAKQLVMEYNKGLLVRIINTPPQVNLYKAQRLRNTRGIFAVNPHLRTPERVILFDDVYTTGSTLNEAAKVLKKAGAKSVLRLAIAR